MVSLKPAYVVEMFNNLSNVLLWSVLAISVYSILFENLFISFLQYIRTVPNTIEQANSIALKHICITYYSIVYNMCVSVTIGNTLKCIYLQG